MGHLERFNPAVMALEKRATLPLFFEIHRLSVFSPRSLDVDVVLDLMIHDIDIVLALARAEPEEIRAAGISHPVGEGGYRQRAAAVPQRLRGQSDCQPGLHRGVRKLRLFQPSQYLSLDYSRQDLAIFSVGANRQIGFEQAAVDKSEPLKLQFDAFLDSVETRKSPKCSGASARQTLGVAMAILDKIKEHSEVVSRSLEGGWKP